MKLLSVPVKGHQGNTCVSLPDYKGHSLKWTGVETFYTYKKKSEPWGLKQLMPQEIR